MATARVERRLAAILAADVAGYSRLMGADEEGTLARLSEHLHVLIDPMIHEHRGRIVKTTGDGLLSEFASVVEAVRCAVAIQRGMAERNVAVPPEERIEFRIGVNVGDIGRRLPRDAAVVVTGAGRFRRQRPRRRQRPARVAAFGGSNFQHGIIAAIGHRRIRRLPG